MDLASVADELYGLPPGEFVAARGRHVAAARTAKDPALAKQIAALRKPTLAAWAGNLLVRSAPEQVDALQRLGEGLRAAQDRLAGDQLRELTRQRNALVAELAREARRLAAEAGQPVGDAVQHEVETTLHAVLADPDAASEWAAGHLAKPLTTRPGFPGTATAATTATTARRPARKRHLKLVADPAKARAEELTRARKEAKSAEREARDQDKALRRDESQRDKAESRLDEATARVADLTGQLRTAEEAETRAREALTHARRTLTATTRATRESRRAAEKAAAKVANLESASDT
ncbi:hypothetical protein [Streptomyces sp. CMB-StM0423]|uniref:hypothetical protein n=1 Tax=Streptomyces sp. CMB-StM0423 TaxID=2059884 RepID=UPI000C7097CE|nr:hypothetical protein [Streptomyces sp. CMB-StM0423]AUH43867.1 hypothetical protein CXR04_30130 [Streptomyces sp. CMB-StM0423]